MRNKKSSTQDRELLITRLLDAPVDPVWEAWTNPEHIASWWGPNGFSTTITRMDLRPGGEWDQTCTTWHMLFETAEGFIRTVKTFKADEGLKQNVEKLSKYLAGMKTK